MVKYEHLTDNRYKQYRDNMNDFEKVVYEELYFFLKGHTAPYDKYSADFVLSTKSPHHNEYFKILKPNAIALFDEWYPLLAVMLEAQDRNLLRNIGDDLRCAQDAIELTWAATQLRKVVSLYLQKQRSE